MKARGLGLENRQSPGSLKDWTAGDTEGVRKQEQRVSEALCYIVTVKCPPVISYNIEWFAPRFKDPRVLN